MAHTDCTCTLGPDDDCPHHGSTSLEVRNAITRNNIAALAGLPTIAQSELNRLVEECHTLRQALAPFASFAEALPPTIEGQPRLTDSGPAFACKNIKDPSGPERVITFADLRKAKELLDRFAGEDFARFITHVERKITGVSENCVARDCFKPILGSEPYHLQGFCSEECYTRSPRRV